MGWGRLTQCLDTHAMPRRTLAACGRRRSCGGARGNRQQMRPLVMNSMKPLLAALLLAAAAAAQTTPAPAPDAAIDAAKLKTALDRATRTLLDSPNLNRHRPDNPQWAAPAAGEERVVFMGDSITDGWGRRYGKFFPGKPYINRGISGQTTPQMLLRFRADVIALEPKAVVILAGTNDISANTGPCTDRKSVV